MRSETRERRRYERAILPHSRELYAAAMRLTRSPSEAEDLVQEAMIRAWIFWHRFEEGSNARAWMHRILMNTFINGYRRRKREREILGRFQHELPLRRPPRPEAPRSEAELSDEVVRALEETKSDFREAVLLVDLQGLSYREAARRVGCPVGTIMSRLHRGRQALQQKLRSFAELEGYVAAA
ncbi:MAG: sigma-70 family RNA polymerase sigma factor [Myxococcales bacterium]|nr:sigma-70 family RNA polymerase sigma factor [Myxococcales bacterium]